MTVEGTIVQIDRPPAAEQVLAIVRRYLPEEQAQGFVAAELDNPSGEFVLYSVRPDHWHSFDFSDVRGKSRRVGGRERRLRTSLCRRPPKGESMWAR